MSFRAANGSVVAMRVAGEFTFHRLAERAYRKS